MLISTKLHGTDYHTSAPLHFYNSRQHYSRMCRVAQDRSIFAPLLGIYYLNVGSAAICVCSRSYNIMHIHCVYRDSAAARSEAARTSRGLKPELSYGPPNPLAICITTFPSLLQPLPRINFKETALSVCNCGTASPLLPQICHALYTPAVQQNRTIACALPRRLDLQSTFTST